LKNSNGHSGDLDLPKVIFGTSGLGNLFVELKETEKLKIVSECVRLGGQKVVFDTAGKYGAGLALETLGKCLERLNVQPENLIISNKLGWIRTELKTDEPTFEPGVWRNLKHDAIQKISFDGIMECFEQGNELLRGYAPQLISVHDPDEYVAAAENKQESEKRYVDILNAYEALSDLKRQGKASAIGVGAKNWRIIQRIANDVSLDWVMIANSMTIKSHPQELLDFILELEKKGVVVINSGVFHSGFLVGSDYYDYRLVDRGNAEDTMLLRWRQTFFELCARFNVKPAEACVHFSLNVPGVKSIALNTTHAKRVRENIEIVNAEIPIQFWEAMKAKGLINHYFDRYPTVL
jgi:D-threo-aldose 1-dehydrogenase